jgi:hypothetical protein
MMNIALTRRNAAIAWSVIVNPRDRARPSRNSVIYGLENIEGYASAYDGYLRAFATCYRAHSAAFRLPDATFPREARVSRAYPGFKPNFTRFFA